VGHEEAFSWAEAQYDAFAERRRLEAEQAAETRYLEDLRSSAKALDATRKKRSPRESHASPDASNLEAEDEEP